MPTLREAILNKPPVPSTGAFTAAYDQFRDRLGPALKTSASQPLFVTEPATSAPNEQWQIARFEKGVILYHRDRGAFAIVGNIWARWDSGGGITRVGYPLGDEKPDGRGRYQEFRTAAAPSSVGAIYHSDNPPNIGTVRDRMLHYYRDQEARSPGIFGYPVGDASSVSQAQAGYLYQRFERAEVFSPGEGIFYVLSGAMLQAWTDFGRSWNARLDGGPGLPIGDAIPEAGWLIQHFEKTVKGSIHIPDRVVQATVAVSGGGRGYVFGGIRKRWLAERGGSGSWGYPIGPQTWVPAENRYRAEFIGVIAYTSAADDGTVQVVTKGAAPPAPSTEKADLHLQKRIEPNGRIYWTATYPPFGTANGSVVDIQWVSAPMGSMAGGILLNEEGLRSYIQNQTYTEGKNAQSLQLNESLGSSRFKTLYGAERRVPLTVHAIPKVLGGVDGLNTIAVKLTIAR